LANTEHERLALEHEGVRRATNQLRRDLDQARQGETARQTLEAFPFVVCPRCEQSLFRRITPADHCVVCLQPDPSRWNDDGQSLNRLSGQLEETSSIEERLADEVKSAAAAVARLAETVAAGQRAVRSIVARATAPHLERANAIHEDIGRLRGERLALKADQSLWIALAVERRQLGQIEPRIEELSADEARRINELAPARQRISDLSEAFDEILRRFTLPWLQTAELDPTSYLPRVNGRTLRELSSGGMKATTNAAYYLAVLVTALRDRNVLTPSFLMLDSIRKDYGAGVKDLARAENIYSYLQTLHDMRHTRGTLSADFQLIVVDNDLPRNFENIFNTIAIDPDQPLIRSG
jgi:hypothetical protein